MIRTRQIGHAPRTARLARELARLQTPCIGCSECRGLCHALIEALVLPEVILGRGEAP